jgi:hypothetical protein
MGHHTLISLTLLILFPLLAACSPSSPPAAVPIIPTIAIIPTDPTVVVGERITFHATADGVETPDVAWEAVCGAIDRAGVYTAPSTPTRCTVRATSEEPPRVAAEVVVTITAPPADPDGHNARYTVDSTCAVSVNALLPTGRIQIDAGPSWSQRFFAEAGFSAVVGAKARCESSVVTVSIWTWREGRWVPLEVGSSSGDYVMATAGATF